MAAVTMINNEETNRRLKAELLNLRRKGALKASADWDSTGPDPDRSCGRCRAELGRIINRGAYCPSCRLKVCKGCREYTFRTTDWICTVCHKRMEIQAISGEWMNEFIRKPSKRRDNRVYVPAADIIKRTIRRSWTISNPLPRWSAPRGSSELRPYSSLPRGQDINNYPSLSIYNTRKSPTSVEVQQESQENKSETKSELDVAIEDQTKAEKHEKVENILPTVTENVEKMKGVRENPLTKAAKEGKLNQRAVAFEMPIKINNPIPITTEKEAEKQSAKIESTEQQEKKVEESEEKDKVVTPEKSPKTARNYLSPVSKKVSFDCTKSADESDGVEEVSKSKQGSVFKKFVSKSLEMEKPAHGNIKVTSKSLDVPLPTTTSIITKNEDVEESRRSSSEHDSEVSSSSVYRRVTVRRRRQDLRKMATVDNGWRRSTESSEIIDFLLPDGDDYKLVFISSDSSSKEEDVDDNDSSSTASSFVIDECDWDYFEPSCHPPRAVVNWSSPFGSPHFYRRNNVLSSPLGSPLVYRRKKSSEVENDERRYSSSPTSSDSFCTKTSKDLEESLIAVRQDAIPSVKIMEENVVQCVHQDVTKLCRSCGNPPQYIPIPVPVPIPVPMPVWPQHSSESVEQFVRARVSQFSRSLNQFPLAWPTLVNSGGIGGDWTSLFSLEQYNAIGSSGTMPVAEDDRPPLPSVDNGESVLDSHQQQRRQRQVVVIAKNEEREIVGDCEEIGGHLDVERSNVFSQQSSNSDSDDEEPDEANRRRNRNPLRRSYNVTGDARESDDALPNSDVYSDNEEDDRLSCGSEDNDDESSSSSSGSADTDSDDTGTVADQKPNRFSKVFVVNSRSSSRSSSVSSDVNEESCSETGCSDKESKCDEEEVVLKNIKRLTDHEIETKQARENNNRSVGWLSSSPALSDVSAESLESSATDDEASPGEEKNSAARLDSSVASASLPVDVEVGNRSPPASGERAGEKTPVVYEHEQHDEAALLRQPARYTSLVMITQEHQQPPSDYPQVNVVASDTTSLVPEVTVQHKNSEQFPQFRQNNNNNNNNNGAASNRGVCEESVTVVSSAATLSNVVCLEEGLADDDSWVENLSHDEDEARLNATTSEDGSTSGDEITLTCTAVVDREDELRGYHRSAIDFTLHTIVEESCEESEVEQSGKGKRTRPHSTTDLEKYFFFGLGDGTVPNANQVREDLVSETSSICSEGLDSLGGNEEYRSLDNDPNDLATSRLEKYFLSGFMGFTTRRDSDGSVGSDSEGHPSPEQRRKRLVRARGTGRSHSSSLDNLLAHEFSLSSEQQIDPNANSSCSSSSDTDVAEENNFEKLDGQFDTVKRKKCKKQRNPANGSSSSMEELKNVEETKECLSDDHAKKDFEMLTLMNNENSTTKQSRDSGFVSSSDDLLKDQKDSLENANVNSKTELKLELESIAEEKKLDEKSSNYSTPPAASLSRKDSFNNWSSDEETNMMMSKMRQFFKTMVASYNTQSSQSSKPTTPVLGVQASQNSSHSSPRARSRPKPPQLVYFENELTRLMKTVPGIRDDQVREIVEYLSSEDTWSDSYDSSDYTSSDLEGNAGSKAALQRQISDSCQQIINKFDTNDKEGDEGDGGLIEEHTNFNPETALVYQKLVASIEKLTTYDDTDIRTRTPHSSPPIIAKVMHHIGSRLVALMHEVSSGESHVSNSPKSRYYHHHHRKIHPKLSNASSTTTEDEDSLTDFSTNVEKPEELRDVLQRSRSHDLLLAESTNLHQSSSGVSDIMAEEKETSDYERFSWRGSFESALMATDSRNKLSLIGSEGSASASALAIAAKRRSAGDLIFSNKSLSREQLDRVRSCGSIGGGRHGSEEKVWVSADSRQTKRRLSVPDATGGSGASADGEDDDDDEKLESRATLPRSLLINAATTNSLPRLPTTTPSPNMHKSQSMCHFFQQNAKSARYRPPGFGKFSSPKRAFSAPGLQPCHRRRNRKSHPNLLIDDTNISEASSSPTLAGRGLSKSATPSPVAPNARRAIKSSSEWRDDDIDRMFSINHNRSCLSTLGIRSDSMASVYSGAGEGRYGTVAVRGQVEFGLQYNYKAGCLEIHIKQCKDLAAVDVKRNRSDPYVKVYLLPDKSKSGKRKTRVKKHTLNPIFDEVLKFHMTLNSIETRTLWLTVWHSDMFGRNDFLGEVMIALENKVFDEPSPKWYNLQERTEPFEEMLTFKGDILVGLKFVPPDMTARKKGKNSRGALHVLVKEAKSLTAIKASGTSDPFCKSYLLPDKGRSSKQKTPVIRKTVNPVWNHTFVYDDVTLQQLSERCLELTIWDHDRLGSNEFLGGVRFSLGTGTHYLKPVDWMDSTGKEISLWKSMLERPNFWVESCLPLRPTLDYRAS